MDRPVDLIPLICTRCSTPVPAEVDEVAWVCAQCGQGLCLDDTDGLLPAEVCYSAAIKPGAKGKPFWVAEGQVTLQRASYGSGGKADREAQKFWSTPQRFFVPAYTCSLEEMLRLGLDLLRQPPELTPGSASPFAPVTLLRADVAAAAEFIVVAVEAGRKDKLKRIDFTLKLATPALWALP